MEVRAGCGGGKAVSPGEGVGVGRGSCMVVFMVEKDAVVIDMEEIGRAHV